MKKIKYLFGIVAVLALFGCENSEDKQLKENILMYGTYESDFLTTEDGCKTILQFTSKSYEFYGYYYGFQEPELHDISQHYWFSSSPWKVKEQKIYLYNDKDEIYSGDILENGRVLLLTYPTNDTTIFTARLKNLKT